MSLFDRVEAELGDKNEDSDEGTGTLGLEGVLVVYATGVDEESYEVSVNDLDVLEELTMDHEEAYGLGGVL